MDGTQIIGGGIPLKSKPRAGFGARALSVAMGTPAITLFENLCYTRAFNRTEFSPSEPKTMPGTLPPGMPRVTTTNFDAVIGIRTTELTDTGGGVNEHTASEHNGDATCNDQITADGRNTQIYLPNGRRTTAHVIENNADGTVATGDGTVINDPSGSTTVGVRFTLLTDAVGATKNYESAGPLGSGIPSGYTGNHPVHMPQTGLYQFGGLPVSFGAARGPALLSTSSPDSGASNAGGGGLCLYTGNADGGLQTDTGDCACRKANVSASHQTVATANTSTGTASDSGASAENDNHTRACFALGPLVRVDHSSIYVLSARDCLAVYRAIKETKADLFHTVQGSRLHSELVQELDDLLYVFNISSNCRQQLTVDCGIGVAERAGDAVATESAGIQSGLDVTDERSLTREFTTDEHAAIQKAIDAYNDRIAFGECCYQWAAALAICGSGYAAGARITANVRSNTRSGNNTQPGGTGAGTRPSPTVRNDPKPLTNARQPQFKGTLKPWIKGATPYSKYTHIDAKTGKAVQNAIYDKNGNVIGHVDFKNHGIGASSGHGHSFPEPGNPSSGHGVGKSHISNGNLPDGWGDLPDGIQPHTPIGD